MSGKNNQTAVPGGATTTALVHDLNNVFGAITGYAQFITEDAPACSPQVDHARKILGAAEQDAALAKSLGLGANDAP